MMGCAWGQRGASQNEYVLNRLVERFSVQLGLPVQWKLFRRKPDGKNFDRRRHDLFYRHSA